MPRPRTDIQPRLIVAARMRFLESGVDGASLREIARDAKTSLGMVFYYFPTKDDLFFAVVEDVYSKLVTELAELVARPGLSTRARFQLVFERLGTVSELELDVLRLVLREAMLSSTRLHRMMERSQRGHLAVIFGALHDGIAKGEIDGTLPLPLLLVTAMTLGGLPQLLRRAAGGMPPFALLPPAPELANLSATLLFRAIGTGSAKDEAEGTRRERTRVVSRAPKKRAKPSPPKRRTS